MFELLTALTAVTGSTAALAIVSSGRGSIPPVVAGWPFVALIGVLAALSPGHLGTIFAALFTALAVLLLFAGGARASHVSEEADASDGRAQTAQVFSAMVLSIPAVAAACLWVDGGDAAIFAALLGGLMPALAVTTRVFHSRGGRGPLVAAATVALAAVVVFVAPMLGGSYGTEVLHMSLALCCAVTAYATSTVPALSITPAGEQSLVSKVTSGLWAVATVALAASLFAAADVALVIAAAAVIAANITSVLLWLRFDITRTQALAQSCDGGTARPTGPHTQEGQVDDGVSGTPAATEHAPGTES